jgi:transcriptional regulator with AAA-type ATPase domain
MIAQRNGQASAVEEALSAVGEAASAVGEAASTVEEPASTPTLELVRDRLCDSWWVDGGPASCPARQSVTAGEDVIIGSGVEVDIRVFDRAVSARHCVLRVERGRLLVEDLGSTNGTFVGGARVERAYLHAGGAFVLGRVVISCDHSDGFADRSDHAPAPPLPGVVGNSAAMQRVVREVRRIANVKAPVLLRGDTGVGKDVLARALHAIGPRSGRPFVPLNVGTLPRELADAELFGHERGAYTGAHGPREGAFVQANGGTLFLDEIAELTLDLQVKLLRVLEDGEVRPLGGRVRKVDVRVVSATWAPLHQRVAEGSFRHDLFQRLAVFVIDVPPLRQRRADLAMLAERFLELLEPEVGLRVLSAGALAKLASYDFPGNVRELRNVLYRAALSCANHVITSADVAASIDTVKGPLRVDVSREQAHALVESHRGNVSAAARQLGLARSTFRDRLAKS